MKILFSPSEAKLSGGSGAALHADGMLFPELFDLRKTIIDAYTDYIRHADDAALQKLLGVKKADELSRVRSLDLYRDPTMKAIRRYSGVAYEYLDYKTLPEPAQRCLDENLIIFSNLFGPILARDMIPWYKLKQGEKLGDLAIEKYYAEHFTPTLDAFLDGEFIIDLRAGFYFKFYKLKQPYITLKFIKNGKVVSHWAKAYRGMVVRALATHRPENEKAFSEIPFENLSILEIQKSGDKTEYIYEIVS